MTQKILIYGGSSGIGLATAHILKNKNFDIHLAGRSEEKLSEAASSLGANFTVGEVTDKDFFARAANEAGGQLDGLIYAIGTINLKSIGRLTTEDFLNDFQVNAMGAALAVQASLAALKKSEGGASVVLFSSVAVRQGFAMHASIGMAKGAVEGLTLSLAAELAPKVRVNSIAPSLTRTPLAEGMLANEQLVTAIAGMHAMQRIGEPEDIASMAAFLVSPESGWITGQVFGVDGGRSTLRTKA